jgi:hypothetical protein
MKNFLKQLFDDNNSINEKALVGFIAFFMLCIALIVDLVTGYMGTALVINEFIFVYLWYENRKHSIKSNSKRNC